MTPRVLLFTCGLAVGLMAILTGCDTNADDSLYDPDLPSVQDPQITDVLPGADEVVLAGIDVVTILGTNFSATADENLVYFDEVRAEVIEASPTELRVRAPNLPSPDLEVRVAVLGAENFSNGVSYRLVPAVEQFGDISPTEEPTGLGSDDLGNAYVSLFNEGDPEGIKRITPEGERSDYFATTFPWSDLAIGPDGALYGVRGVQAVFRLPEGGSQEVWQVVASSARLGSLAFGPDGTLWSGSREGNAYRVAADGESFEEFILPGTIQDLVVFGGALYVAVTQEGEGSRVLRLPIDGEGDLGEAETYVDVSATFEAEALALAFAQDGTLFIGTNSGGFTEVEQRNPIIMVTPGGSAEVLYPGVLGPEETATSVRVRSFAWGPETGLYAVRRFETRGQVTDIFFDLVRIETRRQGL
jgi:hypothetical protein